MIVHWTESAFPYGCTGRLFSSAFSAVRVRCGYVTEFWPVICEYTWYIPLPCLSHKIILCDHLFSSIFSLDANMLCDIRRQGVKMAKPWEAWVLEHQKMVTSPVLVANWTLVNKKFWSFWTADHVEVPRRRYKQGGQGSSIPFPSYCTP